jgi:hypothetical protein
MDYIEVEIDGEVIEFPDTMTDDEINAAAARIYQEKQAAKAPDPAAGMNAFQRGLVGAGASAAKVLEGALGLMGSVVPPARDAAEGMRQTRETYNQNRDALGTAGRVGEVAGAIGSAAPLLLAGPAIAPQMAAGGLYGAVTTPGGLVDRTVGAGLEAFGAGLGNLATRTVGRFFRPAGQDADAVTRLRDAGVDPTFGQTVGAGGPVGRQFRRVEEAAMSTPFTGHMIRDQRVNALQQFARATREGAAPPGAGPQTTESVDHLRSAFKEAYEEVLADPAMRIREMYDIEDGLLRASEGVPVSIDRLQTIQRTVEGLARRHEYAQGRYPTLKQAHAVESELDEMGLRYMRSPNGDEQAMGQVMRNIARDFGEQWRAQAPPGVIQDIREIDSAYRAYVPVRHAAKTNAVSLDPNEYTPNTFLRALRTTDRTPNKNQYIAGTRPQQQLARDAEDVLSSRVPDSGTPERLLTFGALAGAPFTGGGTLAPTALTGLYATRPVQSYLKGQALPRAQQALYDAMYRARPAGAAAGVGLLDTEDR